MALVCTVAGYVGWKTTYCDAAQKFLIRSRCEQDSHTLFTHMTDAASPDIPNLYSRCKIGLHRESSKIVKANGLVETGIENLFTKPNHPDL